MTSETLLIVNGDGAAGALEAAGLVGKGPGTQVADERRLVVLRDVLSCGSLQGVVLTRDLSDWRNHREAFWRRVWSDGLRWRWVQGLFGSVARLPDNLYLETEALAQADRVIACAGAGLSDQLMLAFLVAWIEHLGSDAPQLQVADYHDARRVDLDAPPAGLPHLDPEALAAGWSPRALGADEWRMLLAFWADYVRADDAARERWLAPVAPDGERHAAPTLTTARAAWRSRLSAPPGHLAAWDRALLESSSSEARPLRMVLGHAMRSVAVPLDPVGDLVLLHRIVMLSDPSDGRAWWRLGEPAGPETPCALTAYGAALLQHGSRAAADPRTTDWLSGLASAG